MTAAREKRRGEERRGEERGRGGEERREEERRGEERRGEEKHRNTHKNTLYNGSAGPEVIMQLRRRRYLRKGEERRGEERKPWGHGGVTEACQVIMFPDPSSLVL
ncbi:hypothetical protein D4764_14G0004100 [Takifugu flavidus]|uniref:Uncharacterized protein n=1 Tax=Takifugu flavidus TaxID=433684 RepID=A0A5C6P8A1_9TELE|nr:hypothetical protein D4764_14G0004100 [Takifugu flavidus]